MDKSRFEIIADKVSQVILKYVGSHGYDLNEYKQSNGLFLRIDLLERMLELLRIRNKYLENRLPIELFIQGNVEFRDGGLHFIAPQKTELYRSGTPPIQLQPKLLLFLFFQNFGGEMKVYDVIDNFIMLIWDELDPLDFKKTRTGVTRCFTNTRFAANTLRAYGLLKFTKREAYKTWVLSLPGLLVTSAFAAKGNWKPLPVDKGYSFELHPDIRDIFTGLEDYRKFVNTLSSICRPETKAFNEFKQGSQRAYTLLIDYWAVMWDPKLKKQERRKNSLAYLKRIEQDSEVRNFYEELRRCVKVGDLSLSR
jgi:hypothetical protein